VGTRRVAILAIVVGTGSGCDEEYPLAPIVCDDYCLATQRANCEEDWPATCVRNCEFARSSGEFPDCGSEFDTLLECVESLEASDFECVGGYSEPLPGRCEGEIRTHSFCIVPVFYRCLALCEDRAEHCPEVDADACLRACRSGPDECDNEKIAWLDCELAETEACLPSPKCTRLQVELSDCIDRVSEP
jgi:hypothetical protein